MFVLFGIIKKLDFKVIKFYFGIKSMCFVIFEEFLKFIEGLVLGLMFLFGLIVFLSLDVLYVDIFLM